MGAKTVRTIQWYGVGGMIDAMLARGWGMWLGGAIAVVRTRGRENPISVGDEHKDYSPT